MGLWERLTLQRVLQIQSGYYLVTAIWPIVHFPSFRWVVGPKPDRFQFFTTTWLIAVIGAALGMGARKREPDEAIAALGLLSTAAFIGVELWFLEKIRKVFLVDTAAQALLGAAIFLRLRRGE